MEKILLLYSPKGGNVEKISKKVIKLVGESNIDAFLIDQNSSELLNKISLYKKILLVISTVGRSNWDSFYTKIGWDLFIPELRKQNLSGKTISIIGLGDYLLYPDNFVDSMGILYQVLLEAKANVVGKVSINGYSFENSMAIEGDNFVGLPIDEDNEGELTDSRLKNWLLLVKNDFGL
jgi:flavodoxin I